jgi:acetylornithine aminotransferase
MARRTPSPLDSLAEAPAVKEAAEALLAAVAAESTARALEPEAYRKEIRRLERVRGRPLFFPLLLAGAGRGARVRLADGTMKIDFIGGIGVYGFGHSDQDLLETAVVASAVDTVFQGHLAPGPEYQRLSRALLRHAGKRIRHAWLSISGAMANENALKMILQKRAPADRRSGATCCTSRSTTRGTSTPRSAPWPLSMLTLPATPARSRGCSSSWSRARAASIPHRASSSCL